jgi:hypothetical protein
MIEIFGILTNTKYIVSLKNKGYRYKARIYIKRDKPLLWLFKLKCVQKSYPKVREYDALTRANHMVVSYERNLVKN